MYEEHRHMAESALRMLLVGASFVGARWYGSLIAMVARPRAAENGRPYDIIYGEVSLSIESRFALFADRPAMFPDRFEDIPDVPFHEQVGTIARLARDPIRDVALGERHPHLILTFASGRVFFLNGYDDKYESWTIETTKCSGGDWTIVAVPESDVALFDPANTVDLAEDLDDDI